MKNFYALFLLFLIAATPSVKLKSTKKYNLKVPEPSDICYSANTGTYFIVGDGGYLYETDEAGKIIRKADYSGLDFEGVYADDDNVYVMEEMTRTIIVFDKKTLTKTGIHRISYHGARNKGYEAITYNEAKKCFVVITERDPIWLHELDEKFLVENEIEIKKIRDISAATFHNGKFYVLSDEDYRVYEMNPLTYQVEKIYKLNVLNPEGLCFAPDGTLKVVSDDMQMMFDYKINQQP